MPLTKKGRKIMKSMKKQYGKEKGEQVFYASANKGKIKGVHEGLTKEDIEKYATEEEKEFLGEAKVVKKPMVTLGPIGGGGNIFGYFAAFQRAARREGWSAKEIKAVLDEAKRGDYEHAIATIFKYAG